MALEDTQGKDQQLDSYSDQFVQPKIVWEIPKTPSGPYLPVGNGQCVNFVQAHGFEDYKGNAYEWEDKAIGTIGWPGDAVLLDEGPFMHLALITGTDDGYQLVEQNYIGEYIVSTRSIPFDYNKIVGFIPKPIVLE